MGLWEENYWREGAGDYEPVLVEMDAKY